MKNDLILKIYFCGFISGIAVMLPLLSFFFQK